MEQDWFEKLTDNPVYILPSLPREVTTIIYGGAIMLRNWLTIKSSYSYQLRMRLAKKNISFGAHICERNKEYWDNSSGFDKDADAACNSLQKIKELF